MREQKAEEVVDYTMAVPAKEELSRENLAYVPGRALETLDSGVSHDRDAGIVAPPMKIIVPRQRA